VLDSLLAWLFGLNPALVWFGGGVMCAAVYLVAVRDSEDPSENRQRPMISGALVIIWAGVRAGVGSGAVQAMA
jgi:hypothetical protein